MSDLWRKIFGMEKRDDSLTRVELARVQGTLEALVNTVNARFTDQESRIRANERWRYALPPALLMSAASLYLQLRH